MQTDKSIALAPRRSPGGHRVVGLLLESFQRFQVELVEPFLVELVVRRLDLKAPGDGG